MTIKEFSSLCGCNTQTLRYYDKIDLLKPVSVDPWTGYRYYERGQAINFVKIRNLQAADFSIEEIKKLITLTDKEVYEAFDRKISQQAEKLERIKKLQKSYLTEKHNMEKLLHSISDYLLHVLSDFEVLREFGLSPKDGEMVISQLKEYIERTTLRNMPREPQMQLILNDSVIRGTEQIADALDGLRNKGYEDTVLFGDEAVGAKVELTPENGENVWRCDGWDFVHAFLKDIPNLEAGFEYCFWFQLIEEKFPKGLEFPLFMIATMLPQLDSDEISVGCKVNHTSDGENHFLLLRRKEH